MAVVADSRRLSVTEREFGMSWIDSNVQRAVASASRRGNLHPHPVAVDVEGCRSAGIQIRLVVVRPGESRLDTHLEIHLYPVAHQCSSDTKR